MIRNIDFEGSEIMRSFIDSHCDTITTIMRNNQELFKNESHVDLLRLKKYDNPVQFLVSSGFKTNSCSNRVFS